MLVRVSKQGPGSQTSADCCFVVLRRGFWHPRIERAALPEVLLHPALEYSQVLAHTAPSLRGGFAAYLTAASGLHPSALQEQDQARREGKISDGVSNLRLCS